MKPFKIYSTDDAPPPADAMLAEVKDSVGFVPNIFAVLAESTSALSAFILLNQLFSTSSFNATEREVIQIAASVENSCAYCVAGHTAFGENAQVNSEILDAVRNNEVIADTKLEALNQFTRSVVRNRGMIPAEALEQFLAAGYTPAQVIEVILGVCVKTFSNLANNIIGIPLDDEFVKYQWQFPTHNKAA